MSEELKVNKDCEIKGTKYREKRVIFGRVINPFIEIANWLTTAAFLFILNGILLNLPDSTSPKPEIIVKIIKALVNIHTASPGPSIPPRPLGLVGSSPLMAFDSVSVKTDELVGDDIKDYSKKFPGDRQKLL